MTGSRTADMRSALVDYFREQGRIMIATEAGAEGINLQFCSLVVNYDLPWNPQRIEQRIGRCHRYGQQHDVVVVNFLNRNNAADLRVFQLLSEKFKLFEGVFGASDEVLGAIESGVDFEKRIAAIYQQCRRPEEIQQAFDKLQLELSMEINEAMTRTRQQLMEHFDDEVREKLKIRDEASKTYLNRYERLLIQLSQYELASHAEFIDDSSFRLHSNPFPEEADRIPLGLYELPRRSGEAHLFRLKHPLAIALVEQAKNRHLLPAEILFDYGSHSGKITILEPFLGQSGWLMASAFTIDRQNIIQQHISERNARFFEAEADKLDGWADDLKVGLERELKELDRQIKEVRRAATAALTLEEKLAGQKQIKALESQRNQKRRTLFDAQDEVDRQREALIAQIEGKLQQQTQLVQLFVIRWNIK